MLTPNQFNPHDSFYDMNKAGMLDWEGEMVQPHNRKKVILKDIDEDENVTSSLQILSLERREIKTRLDAIDVETIKDDDNNVLPPLVSQSESRSVLRGVSPLLDAEELCKRLEECASLGMMMLSLGATTSLY